MVVAERDAALAANEAYNARLVTIPRRSKAKNNKGKTGALDTAAAQTTPNHDDLLGIDPSQIFDPNWGHSEAGAN
jgi:hypothetical protein